MRARDVPWKRVLANLALFLTSLSVAVALVEVLVLPRLMESPPLKLQRNFTHTMQILTQSSKKGSRPRTTSCCWGTPTPGGSVTGSTPPTGTPLRRTTPRTSFTNSWIETSFRSEGGDPAASPE